MDKKYELNNKDTAIATIVVLGLIFISLYQYASWSHESAMSCLDEIMMSDNFSEEYPINTPPSKIYKDCKATAIEEREDYEDSQ